MRTPRLFLDAALDTGVAFGLPPSQSHYIRNVLRARAGQPIVLFNGRGGEYAGAITHIERSVVTVELEHFLDDDRESPLSIHIGLAVTKRDAMDTAIQKATELGVHEITPLITEFTATSHKSLDKRAEHWTGVIRSAAEQCERNRLPALNPVARLDAFLADITADLKLIAHPARTKDRESPMAQEKRPEQLAVLIGPEGGFSGSEVAAANAAGFQSVGLGPRILRADTAPLVIVSLAQARWGDLLDTQHVRD